MCLRKSSCTFFAIAALALAACGDGGDGTTTTTGDPNPSGELNDLLLTATQQERNASTAKTAADMALKDAKEKAAMLSAAKVLGESSKARDNAQAVLDATGKVDQALKDATAALNALEKAKTEADKLPADTPKLEELKTSIADAIAEATKHRDAVKAIKDAKATETGSLAAQRQMVNGVNGDMSLDDLEAKVAVAVEKAVTPFSSGLEGVEAADLSNVPMNTGGQPTLTTHWHFYTPEIGDTFGEDSGTEAVIEYNSMVIHKLPGVRLESTDYAYYGYWLAIPSESEDNKAPVPELVATFSFPHLLLSLPDGALNANTSLGNSATYNGNALGISVLTADDGKGGQKAIKSGEFTADVRLTATFAGDDDSKVEGEVYNFKGNAVGDDWSVKLLQAKLLGEHGFDRDPSIGHANTTVPGVDYKGRWYGAAYGATVDTDAEPTKRPTGIGGHFTAFFPNGRAVAGYTAEEKE